MIESTDLLISFIVIAEILFLWFIKSMLLQDNIELTEQINLISYKLESVINGGQETLLNNELLHIVAWHSQVLNRLSKPFLGFIGSLLIDFWNELLNSIIELFWSWLELLFDSFRVQL